MKGQDPPYKRRKPKLSAVCMWSFWKPLLKCWLKLDVIDHVRGTIWTNRRRTRSGNMHFFYFKNTVFTIKENWFYVHLSMRFCLFVGFCFCFLFFFCKKSKKEKKRNTNNIYCMFYHLWQLFELLQLFKNSEILNNNNDR